MFSGTRENPPPTLERLNGRGGGAHVGCPLKFYNFVGNSQLIIKNAS